MPRRLTCALLLSCLIAAPACAATPPPPASSLSIQPYDFPLRDGTTLKAERGTFMVPENRDDPRSRMIEIGFVRFKSTSPTPGAPLVYLAGGPGGSGVGAARGVRQPIFLALREVADVIALDQRGTGMSNQVPPCTADRPMDPAAPLTERTLAAYYRETLDVCLGRWRAAGVAVEGYTTRQSAADIEDLRKALGVPKVDLWGISYGTHLALAALRAYPDSIGRVALASVEGMDQTVKLPSRVDAAFERLDGALAGELTPTMRRVHARFDAEPQRFTLQGPQGELTFRADSFPLRMLAGGLAKNPDGGGRLVQLYQALDAGVTDPAAPLIYGYFLKDPLVMTGMPELMDLASGITDRRRRQVEAEAGSSLLGRAVNFPMPQFRGAAPALDLGDRFRSEVRSAVPVLLFSGELDVRTPLEEQAAATAGLAGLHRIVVRNGGHDLFEAHPDVPGLLAAFFRGEPIAVDNLTLPPPQ